MSEKAWPQDVWIGADVVGRYVADLTAGRRDEGVTAPTGLRDLDAALDGGLYAGTFTLVTGASGVGKSVLTLSIARHAAVARQVRVLYLAPRTPEGEILARLAAAEAHIPVGHLRSGRASLEDLRRIQHLAELERAPIFVNAGWTASNDRATVVDSVDLGVAGGAQLVVVDPLPGGRRVSSALQSIAVAHAVAVVGVTASPGVIARAAPSADLHLELQRDDLENPRSVRPGEADLHVRKNRYGPTRTVPLIFYGHYARFDDDERGQVSS